MATLAAGVAGGLSPAAGTAGAASCAPQWVGSWGRSAVFAAPGGLRRQTVRQVSHLSAGGRRLRLRLSNAAGTRPVTLTAVSVGLQRGHGPALRAGTHRLVTFSGARSVTLAAGGTVRSDIVALRVAPFANVVTSLYAARPTGPVTVHPDALQTAYVASGDHTADRGARAFSALPETGSLPRFATSFLTDVDVLAPHGTGTVVALGDSITNGAASTPDADRRYPDDLARRLAPAPGPVPAVSNQGIGGNFVTSSRAGAAFGGPSMLTRLRRDVLGQPGLRDVILLGGINDVGGGVPASAVIAAMRTIGARVHAAGARVIGATLTPSGDPGEAFGLPAYSDAAAQAVRAEINAFIRTSDTFDAVVDTDAAVRDPLFPSRLQDRYDSGDHLHPNDAGYRAMAAAIDLRALDATGRRCRRPA